MNCSLRNIGIVGRDKDNYAWDAKQAAAAASGDNLIVCPIVEMVQPWAGAYDPSNKSNLQKVIKLIYNLTLSSSLHDQDYCCMQTNFCKDVQSI